MRPVTPMPAGRLFWTMNEMMHAAPGSGAPERRLARAERLVTWILLGLGLLLMLASVGRAEEPSVSRTERFQGPMKAGQTVQVENISGDIVASPGKEFSAVVTITVSAPTRTKAEDTLAQTRILSQHDEDGWSLETRWPGMHGRGRGGRHGSPCSDCRVTARYEILVPVGVAAELSTVNGNVRVRDCDGEMKLESVNGSIEARGLRRTVEGQTVNGNIEAVAASLPAGASVDLQSVNGSVTLTLPKDARFELSASTMNGTIASTFPLPVAAAESQDASSDEDGARDSRNRHTRRVIVHGTDGEETEVDLRELERDLEGSLRDAEASIEQGMQEAERTMRETKEGMREVHRQMREIRIADPHRQYSGAIGGGGSHVDLTTLNGKVVVLAAGTREEDAKPLLSRRRSFAITVPEVRVRVAAPPAAPMAPAPPSAPVAPLAPVAPAAPVAPLPPPPFFEGEIVRGDVGGDFLSTSAGGNYRIGKVSGRVKILTHSGEIRVGGAGAGADLKTFGGDIVVGPVTGDLKASTMAGDIRAGRVAGSALADTAGGDIRVDAAGANLDANTAGGDIVVPSVGGSVRAVTAGGDVRIGVTTCGPQDAVTIRDSGGDVTLWLPLDCKASLDLAVTGADRDDTAIRSEFPELSLSRKGGAQRGIQELNGGGGKIVVRTSSGTIRIKKGAAS
jgi:DUF4097 and DUF4098 domain-containing protein YvlB